MSVSLAVFSKFALLTLANLEKGYFALYVRNSAMQIIGSGQIVTDVTFGVPTLFGCIALFDLFLLLGFTVTFALFVRMCWGVSPLRRRFSGAPRPPKNPLASWAQLDQLMGFAWYLRPRRNTILQLTANPKPPPPQKNKN